MEKLLATGKTRAIGVANCSVPFLEELLPSITVVPAVNQIENHPELPQQEIVDFCKSKGIHVTAYSPFGSSGGPLLELDDVKRVAEKKGVEVGTVLLSWHREWALFLCCLDLLFWPFFLRFAFPMVNMERMKTNRNSGSRQLRTRKIHHAVENRSKSKTDRVG
jgi:hypothetical protein